MSEISLSEKYILENKIINLQKALVLEQEKNQILELELRETHKKIRMLNKGSINLDKILSMGRTEKTTTGLGYQGSTSRSHTVFVRGNYVVPDKNTTVVLEDAKNKNKEIAIAYSLLQGLCLSTPVSFISKIDEGFHV